MTDKQIIIDDIDVSGCKYYDEKKLPLYNCLECINHFKPCMSNNCYYKQLVKYKQALTEIKEIAVGKNFAFLDNDDVVLKILEKLSEVLDE